MKIIQRIKNFFGIKDKLTYRDIQREDILDDKGNVIGFKYLIPVNNKRSLSEKTLKALLWEYSDNHDRVISEVLQENRDRAISSILNNIEYTPMKIEDHPDYLGTKKIKL